AGLLFVANAAQTLEAAYRDRWEIRKLDGVNKRLREAERSQIEAGGKRLLLLFSIGISDARIEHGPRTNQIRIVNRNALIRTVHHVASGSCDAGKIVVEIEECVATVEAHERLILVRQLVIEF